MKAAIYTQYGPPDVVTVQEVPKPQPRSDELLVKVIATTVNTADMRLRSCNMPTLLFQIIGRLMFGVVAPRRRILGSEVAGIVETVGRDVTEFKPGDAVVAYIARTHGGHAEYVCIRQSAPVTHKPSALSFDEAAAIPFGASTSLYYLRDLAQVTPGQRVLIVGASGCLGVYGVQLGKHLGAHVTGVCSTRNVERVRDLGADHVIDYTREDFTTRPETYDVIYDTVGVTSFNQCTHVLTPDGCYLPAVFGNREILQMLWTTWFGRQKVRGGVGPEKRDLLEYLHDLVGNGHLRAVIDRVLPLADIVEAHRLVDSGRKVGSVVIAVHAS